MLVRIFVGLLLLGICVSIVALAFFPVMRAERTMTSPPVTLEEQLTSTDESIKRMENRHHGSPVETWPQPEQVIWHEYQENRAELLRRRALRNQ